MPSRGPARGTESPTIHRDSGAGVEEPEEGAGREEEDVQEAGRRSRSWCASGGDSASGSPPDTSR